jgi:thiopeptide-type bacteriocin biosynthesis protein
VFVESGEIILWCERLGKRVIPRVTSALAVEAITRPSLYWFLGNLQHQGRLAGASWDWGPLAHAGFLPRVCIGTVIVSLASWKLPRAWPGAWKAGDGERRIAMVRALRDQRGIPRRVAVASAGERILVDLDDASSTEVGFEMFDSADDAPRLTELVPGASVPAVRSEYGRHMSEILLPFRRRGARPRVTEPRAPANDTRPVPHGGGVVLPGAEWLYLRLAIPASSTDRILYEVVRPMVQRRGRELHEWFFVRHLHDGAPELRLRFHGDPDFLWRELLRGLHAGVARCGAAVHGVRIDTYERELSRYGGEVGTQLVESLACCDSDWVIGLLDAPASAADLDRLRFEIALLSVRRLIDDFALDLHQRHRLFAARHAAMVPELAAKTRHAIAAKLHDRRSASVELPAAVAGETARLLDARSASVRSIVAALRDARLDDRVLPSVLHHAMCRILTGHEFAQELAAYALLLRESERDVRRT